MQEKWKKNPKKQFDKGNERFVEAQITATVCTTIQHDIRFYYVNQYCHNKIRINQPCSQNAQDVIPIFL